MRRTHRTCVLFCWLVLFLLLLCPLHISSEESQEIRTVHNGEKGLWDDDPSKSFRLVPDLSIGVEDGDTNYVFGRVFDIAVDSRNTIYVLDNGYCRIQVYDSAGAYIRSIGRKGEGPGEFSFPTAIALDESGKLYVASRGRISIFDADGTYIDEFRHQYPDCVVRSLRVDVRTGIYFTCLDIFERLIVHRYSMAHEYLLSFSHSFAEGKDIDVRVEQNYGGGKIDIDDEGMIYFTQLTPYEIRKFSPAGELLTVVYRENNFMPPPEVEVRSDGALVMGMFAGSSVILVLDDKKFVNVVRTPPTEGEPASAILDLFASDGRLLISRRENHNMKVRCSDADGRLYAGVLEGWPRVVRYRTTIN